MALKWETRLFGNINRFAKVLNARLVNDLLARVVPVKVHNRFLKSKQVINGGNDHIHGGRVSCLCSQVILKFEIVTFAEQLQETEKCTSELGIVHVLLASGTLRANAKTFRLLVS